MRTKIEFMAIIACFLFLAVQWLPTSAWVSVSAPAAIYVPQDQTIVVDFDKTVRLSSHVREDYHLMKLEGETWNSICSVSSNQYYTTGNHRQVTRRLGCEEDLQEGVYQVVTRWHVEPSLFSPRTVVKSSNSFLIPG
jgi:hypothetical protein